MWGEGEGGGGDALPANNNTDNMERWLAGMQSVVCRGLCSRHLAAMRRWDVARAETKM